MGWPTHVMLRLLGMLGWLPGQDLGFYLANYSRADCMSWGHRQGCAYVRSRCGDGRHDASAFLAPADHTLCKGDPYWARRPDSYLASKCEGGNNPCGGTGHYVRGSRDGVLGATCDAQCHYGPGVERAGGCLTAPSSGVESAGDSVFDTLKEGLTSVDWNAWLIPLIWLAAACFLGSCLRSVLCPRAPSASRRLALSLNAFLWLLVGADRGPNTECMHAGTPEHRMHACWHARAPNACMLARPSTPNTEHAGNTPLPGGRAGGEAGGWGGGGWGGGRVGWRVGGEAGGPGGAASLLVLPRRRATRARPSMV